MRILVVDDDFLGREILLTFLAEYGTCDSACDGGEALEKFYAARASETPYDLICLDVLMPVLDGNRVLAEIRKAEADGRHRSCIFIITGHETPELVENLEGADDFISKPCSANLVKRLFEQHHLLNNNVYKKHHVLVVSTNPNTRARISSLLHSENISSIECGSFTEAERAAQASPFSAVVADVPSIVKSRDDEQLAVFSLQNIYPLVRVKISGDHVLPIIMTTEERGQSLTAYLEKVCSTFASRPLRRYKRYDILVPVSIRKSDGQTYQTFTLKISWGGAFIVMNSTWELVVGSTLSVDFPTLGSTSLIAEVVRMQPWGIQGVAPGFGIKWKPQDDPTVLDALNKVLKSSACNDQDRLLG